MTLQWLEPKQHTIAVRISKADVCAKDPIWSVEQTSCRPLRTAFASASLWARAVRIRYQIELKLGQERLESAQKLATRQNMTWDSLAPSASYSTGMDSSRVQIILHTAFP